MSSQRLRMRTETRITRHFFIEDKKFRLCYIPRGGLQAVSVQLNYHIAGMGPFLHQIVCLGKYRTIRVYLNQKYVPSAHAAMPQFLEAVAVPGYRVSTAEGQDPGASQDIHEYTLVCVIEKE